PVLLDERGPPTDLTPGPEDVGTLREVVWIEVSKPRERSVRHALKLPGGGTYLQPLHRVAHCMERPRHEHRRTALRCPNKCTVEIPQQLGLPTPLARECERIRHVPA